MKKYAFYFIGIIQATILINFKLSVNQLEFWLVCIGAGLLLTACSLLLPD